MPVEYVVIVDWHVSLLELFAPEIEGATNMFVGFRPATSAEL